MRNAEYLDSWFHESSVKNKEIRKYVEKYGVWTKKMRNAEYLDS